MQKMTSLSNLTKEFIYKFFYSAFYYSTADMDLLHYHALDKIQNPSLMISFVHLVYSLSCF